MNVIKTNLNNFLVAESLLDLMNKYGDNLVYDQNNVIKAGKNVHCPNCQELMVRNGINLHGKKKIAKNKVQRMICPKCKNNIEIAPDILDKHIQSFLESIKNMILTLRSGYLSFELIADALKSMIEISPDTVRRMFETTVDNTEIPMESSFQIVHYDEQHPKKGKAQKFRLSLFDGILKQMIVEELSDGFNEKIVEDFLDRHLPRGQMIFLVSDQLPLYNELFMRLRPGYIIHQHCLLHLNKNIVLDFHRNCSFSDELYKYMLLNIFYDRRREIEYLQSAKQRERTYLEKHGEKEYHNWLLEMKKDFHIFVHDLEKKRRKICKRKKIPNRMNMWSLEEARKYLNNLLMNIDIFPSAVRRRIKKIQKGWSRFTAFYGWENAPATNNALENYFSCSCKQIKKKQHRRNTAMKRQWKLYAMRRAGLLKYDGPSLFDVISILIPFRLPT